MKLNDKIFVTGHNGLVGSAIVRKLKDNSYDNILVRSRNQLDLTKQKEVYDFFEEQKPEYVFLSAGKVGGINYNKNFSADFIRDNLLIQTNIIDAAYKNKCKKLLFLGSACIYPKNCPMPIKEEYLMTSPLEETNISYAISKISGLLMCRKYTEQYGFNTISVMPNNIYGINDNFRIDECHVIPSFIRRFIEAKKTNAKEIMCFGDGSPIREFLFSDDVADACIFLMKNYNDPDIINIGPNREISIKELSETIANIIGYNGKIVWDTNKPNGTPKKILETSKMDQLGWKSKVSLEDGLKMTIDWYIKNGNNYDRL